MTAAHVAEVPMLVPVHAAGLNAPEVQSFFMPTTTLPVPSTSTKNGSISSKAKISGGRIMASRAHIGSASALPSPALLESAIRRLSRAELADLCEQLIDRMDAMDPDSDLEFNGDEQDHTGSEEEDRAESSANSNARLHGLAGCPLADGLEDGDSDYCLASDDRGSSGPNANFPGFVAFKEIEADEDCERWHQPTYLN